MYFCTGPAERKAKNHAENAHCVLTTGDNHLDGLDLVLEGTAERVADTYELKYGPHLAAPDGTWSGLGDVIRQAEIPLFRVVPAMILRVRQGKIYTQTR
jgi:hypothetical protein